MEMKAERAKAVWERRCHGATYAVLAKEFGVSTTTIFKYIEEARREHREACVDMAAQEREAAIQQLDHAIMKLWPYIDETPRIETIKYKGDKAIIQSVEEYDARLKASQTLAKLLEQKAKLLGLYAPVQTEDTTKRPPQTAEDIARGNEILRRWSMAGVAPRSIMGGEVE